MIMKIEDVISFISASVPFSYYANTFPATKKNCGFVRVESGGNPHDYILGLKSPSIQVVIRHEKGSEAERISKEIWNLFHGKEHFTIGTTKIKFASCDQSEPIYLDTDKNGRTMYSINVSFITIE